MTITGCADACVTDYPGLVATMASIKVEVIMRAATIITTTTSTTTKAMVVKETTPKVDVVAAATEIPKRTRSHSVTSP